MRPKGAVCVPRFRASGDMSPAEPTRLSSNAEGSRHDLPAANPAGGAATPRVRALEFVRRMRGASQPWLVRCEDGESYVVKFQNNPQHARVLANEMLASRLAQLVGPARRRSGVCGSLRLLAGQQSPTGV